HAPVGLLDQLDDEFLAVRDRLAVQQRAGEGGGGERRGDLAGLGTAHPVGDREERRLADERVLVAAALLARVRVAVAPAEAHVPDRLSLPPGGAGLRERLPPLAARSMSCGAHRRAPPPVRG